MVKSIPNTVVVRFAMVQVFLTAFRKQFIEFDT